MTWRTSRSTVLVKRDCAFGVTLAYHHILVWSIQYRPRISQNTNLLDMSSLHTITKTLILLLIPPTPKIPLQSLSKASSSISSRSLIPNPLYPALVPGILGDNLRPSDLIALALGMHPKNLKSPYQDRRHTRPPAYLINQTLRGELGGEGGTCILLPIPPWTLCEVSKSLCTRAQNTPKTYAFYCRISSLF